MTAGGSHSLAPDPSAFVGFCLPTIAMVRSLQRLLVSTGGSGMNSYHIFPMEKPPLKNPSPGKSHVRFNEPKAIRASQWPTRTWMLAGGAVLGC